MIDRGFVRKAKLAAMTALLGGGMLLGSACSLTDFQANFVAGTQAFVKGYTTDLFEALFPPADELITFDLGGTE